MKGYQTCSITSNPALQCLTQGFYSRLELDTQVKFSDFTDRLKTINWTIVNADGSPISSTESFTECVQGKLCIPVAQNASIDLLLVRPRIANKLELVGYTPLGYILLNYTSNSSQFPVNASWYNSSATCSGQASAAFEPPFSSCANMVPDYLNYEYLTATNLCGNDAYQPMIDEALLGSSVSAANNGASSYIQCLNGAACYPCPAANSTLRQNNTVMYSTLAFGQCSVYRVSSITQVYVDLLVNVTIGSVSRFMYVGGMYDTSRQNVMKLSRLSPTLRASILITIPDGFASQTADYIITCDGHNPNSTQPAGVMGPVNLAFNTSGYVPNPQWSDFIHPIPFSNQTMNGGWISMSSSEFETSFSQTTQDLFPCGKSQISPVAYGPTYSFYTSQSMVDQACAVNESIYTDGANSSLAQGRCVPGYWPEYGLTVCQRFARMTNYSQTFINLGYPVDYPPSEDLPQGNNIRNFQFFLFQHDDDDNFEETDTDGAGTLYLMQTAPSITDQVMMQAHIVVDISTDVVPYTVEGAIQVAFGAPPAENNLCRFNQNISRGFLQQSVCILTDLFPSSVQLTVYDCNNGVRFLPNETEPGWTFSSNDTVASFETYVALDASTACFNTTFLTFYVDDAATIAETRPFVLLPGDCKISARALGTDQEEDVEFYTYGSITCSITDILPPPNFNIDPPNNTISVWWWVLFAVIIVVLFLMLAFSSVVIAVYVNNQKAKKTMDHATRGLLQGTNEDDE
ncbi:MAG: hypothetical protein JSS82_00220 [Bacteroidetes bacterium]|nr:hypothetical protein [Bacteroidota bacterium]